MLNSSRGGVRCWWPPGLAFGVMTLVYFSTFGGGFIADDFVYVSLFAERSFSNWPLLFVREWSEGVWGFQLKELRPFSALSFMVDARLWGGQAWGYRLTNFLLHTGTVALVMRLVGHYCDARAFAVLAAGCVFALHPVVVEPVVWITGRSDVLATLCALLFWCAAEAYEKEGRVTFLAVAGVAYGVSAFSKEYGLSAPLLLALSWLLIAPKVPALTWKRRLGLLAIAGVVVALYAVCRHEAFGDAATSSGAGWRDPAVWQRQASYVGWLLPVLPLTTGGEWASPFPVRMIQVLWVAVLVGAMVATAVCAWRGRTVAARLLFFGGCWPMFTLGLLLVVHYFTPRHLYFTLAGPVVALGILLSTTHWRTASWAAAVGAIAWTGWAHAATVAPWREAGRVSAEALEALNRGAQKAPAGAVALLAVPDRFGAALLWPWASPQVAGSHYVTPGFAPDDVLESTENYCRPERWAEERMAGALSRLERAPGAVALFVRPDGSVVSRVIDGQGLRAATPRLGAVAIDGITSTEWTAWVRSVAEGL